MGLSDEIEVATIATDDGNISFAMTSKNPQKCAARSCLFSRLRLRYSWETIPLELKKLCYYRFSKHFKLYLLNSQSVS